MQSGSQFEKKTFRENNLRVGKNMKPLCLCLLLLVIPAYSAMAQRPNQSLQVTDEDVGDSASFNKDAKFFGVALTGQVIVSASCDPLDLGFELGPDDRCIAVTDPSV